MYGSTDLPHESHQLPYEAANAVWQKVSSKSDIKFIDQILR